VTGGQLDFEGNEQVDPRVTSAAMALWERDAKRTWGESGRDVAREQAERLWPRVRGEYERAARVALEAAA
jgi:hypothetical protein